MEKKKDCKIVQDLLPNYIEELTNEKTNKYIEEHLKECDECKKTLENMEKELKLNNSKRDNREVKYIKKFSKKMRTLKIILLAILIIFIIVTGRKMFIISNLSNKAEQYVNSDNYHKITYSYDKDIYTKSEIFHLGDKKKIVITQLTDTGITTRQMFATKLKEDENADSYLVNIYFEVGDSKVVALNEEFVISTDIQNALYSENFFHLLLGSISASVHEVKYNNKDCYYISESQGIYTLAAGTYFDKETGLMERTISEDFTDSVGTTTTWPAADYVYEFNTVTEEDFIEPDISEYEMWQ